MWRNLGIWAYNGGEEAARLAPIGVGTSPAFSTPVHQRPANQESPCQKVPS